MPYLVEMVMMLYKNPSMKQKKNQKTKKVARKQKCEHPDDFISQFIRRLNELYTYFHFCSERTVALCLCAPPLSLGYGNTFLDFDKSNALRRL